jgi:hypothetical protein
MSVCVYSVFALPRVGSGLATGWSSVQGVLPTLLGLRNWSETKSFTDALCSKVGETGVREKKREVMFLWKILARSREQFFSYFVQIQWLLYVDVVALYYTAVTLHFLRNMHSNKSTDTNLFRLSEQEHPVSMLPLSKPLYIKAITFSSHFALKCKLKTTFFTRLDLNVKFMF